MDMFLVEEWNKRLVKYIDQIENSKFEEKNFDQFFYDIVEFIDFKLYKGYINRKKKKILSLIEDNDMLKNLFAKKFKCNLNEISFGRDLYLHNNKIQFCLGCADFQNSRYYDLSNLESIGEYADFYNSQVTDLSNLQSIGGYADFEDSQVTDLKKLKVIGGYADFTNSKVTDLSSLESIGGNAHFRYTNINLSSLKSIGGDAEFRYSQITNLSSLQSIAGYADFSYSKVIDLSNLQSVGGSLNLVGSEVNNLHSLKEVKGNIYLNNWQAKLFGDMFVEEGDHYRFVPEDERIRNIKAENKEIEESEM